MNGEKVFTETLLKLFFPEPPEGRVSKALDFHSEGTVLDTEPRDSLG